MLALIDLTGGDAVAKHLRHVFERHFAPAHIDLAVLADAVVDPIFKVVAVAPLVMELGKAHAVLAALGVVRAAIPLIILDAAEEFRGAVFAQIVPYSLCIQAEAKTVPPHQTAVTCDGLKCSHARIRTSPLHIPAGRPLRFAAFPRMAPALSTAHAHI